MPYQIDPEAGKIKTQLLQTLRGRKHSNINVYEFRYEFQKNIPIFADAVSNNFALGNEIMTKVRNGGGLYAVLSVCFLQVIAFFDPLFFGSNWIEMEFVCINSTFQTIFKVMYFLCHLTTVGR